MLSQQPEHDDVHAEASVCGDSASPASTSGGAPASERHSLPSVEHTWSVAVQSMHATPTGPQDVAEIATTHTSPEQHPSEHVRSLHEAIDVPHCPDGEHTSDDAEQFWHAMPWVPHVVAVDVTQTSFWQQPSSQVFSVQWNPSGPPSPVGRMFASAPPPSGV